CTAPPRRSQPSGNNPDNACGTGTIPSGSVAGPETGRRATGGAASAVAPRNRVRTPVLASACTRARRAVSQRVAVAIPPPSGEPLFDHRVTVRRGTDTPASREHQYNRGTRAGPPSQPRPPAVGWACTRPPRTGGDIHGPAAPTPPAPQRAAPPASDDVADQHRPVRRRPVGPTARGRRGERVPAAELVRGAGGHPGVPALLLRPGRPHPVRVLALDRGGPGLCGHLAGPG